MKNLTETQKHLLYKNIDKLKKLVYTKDQVEYAYQFWMRGHKTWCKLGLGGTYIMLILCWYHTHEKPKCREWRPAIIVKKLISEEL